MPPASLYNRWRSRTFAELDDQPMVGQEHITRTLRNAVASGQIAHAYLFCGPRGTGKTSAARILARAVNCRRGLRGEPCNECENCQALLSGRQLDLMIEIDGASNRGVDDVRQLRERIMQRPGGGDVTGRYKVYIIDEVHMLTTEAFNALLKSLEEPPPHVIFVLATTDPQKVLPTVVSRCQRFDFRPIPLETLAGHLAHIAKAEGVKVEPAAIELLARAASGGARDAVSLLDQAMAFAGAAPAGEVGGGVVTTGQVQAMLGITESGAVSGLVDAIGAGDLPAALRLIHEVSGRGADLRQFSRQVVEFLRAVMLAQSGASTLLSMDEESLAAVEQRAARLTSAQVVGLIKLFNQAEQGLKAPSVQPQLPLELAVVEALVAPTPLSSPIEVGVLAARHEAATTARSAATTQPGQEAAPVRRRVQEEVRASDRPPAWPADQEAPLAAGVTPIDAAALDAVSASSQTQLVEERDVPPPARPVAETRSVEATDRGPRPGGSTVSVVLETVQQEWPAVLDDLRRSGQRSLEALLRGGRPVAVEDGNVVVVQFKHRFHRDKVQDISNRIAVEKALGRVLGTACKVRCVVEDGGEPKLNGTRSQSMSNDPVVVKALRIWRAHILTPEQVAEVDAMPVVSAATVLEAKE
jgi:DNA polymerase-3 subunit gamma/tau